MKWSMMVTGQVMQFNLTPENDHEKEAFSTLNKFQGLAHIHKGVNIQKCQGGYLRDFSEEPTSVAITIHKDSERNLSVGVDHTAEGTQVTVIEKGITPAHRDIVIFSEFYPREVAPS